MPSNALTALSPLDGRYAGKVDPLRDYFSEFALIRHRVRVELAWFAALADEPLLQEMAPFTDATRATLSRIGTRFGEGDRRFSADTAGGAGDDSDAAIEGKGPFQVSVH